MTARAAVNDAGGYDYHCPEHPNFKGTVSGSGDAVTELRKHDRNQHAQMGDGRRAALTPEQIETIKVRLADGAQQKALGVEFGVGEMVIHRIKRELVAAE